MSLLDNLAKQFSQTNSEQMGGAVEDMTQQAITQRRVHERRWYDNNFFDDGFHFRVISKKTGRVIDSVNRNSGYVERAIPRASRQIRGVANLLFAAEPYPVVYPERTTIEQFTDQSGQVNQQAFEAAMEKSKDIARKRGVWLSTEWDEEQELPIKLIDMLILAAKNSVSWLQVYSDPDDQKIITSVYDAFDVICFGDRRDEQELPFITKASPDDFKSILTDPRWDPKMVEKVSPDNKYATSDIKDAYMRSRYGAKLTQKDGQNATVIRKETFIKEYLSESNWDHAVELSKETGAMDGKSKGDQIMRQIFSVGGITLKDSYIDYDEYPLVAFRYEPGPLYQVPFIERFIPQNKSLDVITTRLEKWINAMVVGVYQKRKGENFEVSNFPGGQMVEYETTPLTQMNTASPGTAPFELIELLNKFIDEQGATTAGGMNVPQGVKSGTAIESVKATEYSNLKISTLMLKKTIKNIASRMLERAHKDYLQPQEVESLKDGEPNYFDVIGKRGFDLSQKVNKPLPRDTVVLDKDAKVRIEVEPGLGLTMDGKRQAMQSILTFMIQLAQAGYIPPAAMQMVVKRFLETFGYGSTEELMEAMENGMTDGQMSDQQIQQMKIALLQTMQDAGTVGPQADNKLVDTTKVGVLEAFKESGLADKLNTPTQPVKESVSINYKDAPEDIKRQMEKDAGFTPSNGLSPAGSDQLDGHIETKAKLVASKAKPQPMEKGGEQNGSTE